MEESRFEIDPSIAFGQGHQTYQGNIIQSIFTGSYFELIQNNHCQNHQTVFQLSIALIHQ